MAGWAACKKIDRVRLHLCEIGLILALQAMANMKQEHLPWITSQASPKYEISSTVRSICVCNKLPLSQ